MKEIVNSIATKKLHQNFKFLVFGIALITIYFRTDVADPFNSIKFLLLILFASWLLGLLADSFKRFPIKLESFDAKILSMVVIFLISLLISALLTDEKYIAFVGDTQRKNGFLTYFCLAIILLYAARTINFENCIFIFKVGIWCNLLLGTYGIIQITGNDFVNWLNPYNSMISTVGNPNFASAILAILSLLSFFGLFISNLSKFFKVISSITITISIFCIVSSDSRQGLLVIFFGALFYITVLTYVRYKKLKNGILLLTIILTTITILGMLQKGPLASLLYKDSVSVRGYYWRAGIEMFKDNIFTGVGVDRYGAYFKQFREISYPLKYGYEINSSNAHNVIIQLFSTAGLFVGLSYIVILGIILNFGLNLILILTGNQQKIAAAIVSTWIGFQSQTIISIDNIGVSVWGWLFGGAILGLSMTNFESNQRNHEIKSKENKKYSVTINYFQITIVIFFLIISSILAAGILKSEKDMYNLRNFANPSIPEQKLIVLKYASSLFNNKFADPNYKIEAASATYEMGYREEVYLWVDQLISEDGRNLDFLRAKAFLLESLNNFDEAVNYRELIREYDPWNFINLIDLANLHIKTKNQLEARKILNHVIDFAPNSAVSIKAIEILGRL